MLCSWDNKSIIEKKIINPLPRHLLECLIYMIDVHYTYSGSPYKLIPVINK